jgi:hypothetical protein
MTAYRWSHHRKKKPPLNATELLDTSQISFIEIPTSKKLFILLPQYRKPVHRRPSQRSPTSARLKNRTARASLARRNASIGGHQSLMARKNPRAIDKARAQN